MPLLTTSGISFAPAGRWILHWEESVPPYCIRAGMLLPNMALMIMNSQACLAVTGIIAVYYELGVKAHWWTSSGHNEQNAWLRRIHGHMESVERTWTRKDMGFSVRCIKN